MSDTSEGRRKSGEGARRNPQNANPAKIERFLNGIHYPASKDELLKQAEDNAAPEDILYILNKFENKKYNTTIDVRKEVGHIE